MTLGRIQAGMAQIRSFLESDFHEKVVFVKPDVAGCPHAAGADSRCLLQGMGFQGGSKEYPASTTPLPHLGQAAKKPPIETWGFFAAK